MIGKALDEYRISALPNDAFHDADACLFFFQHKALLDMQLDESGNIRTLWRSEGSLPKPGGMHCRLQRDPVFVLNVRRSSRRIPTSQISRAPVGEREATAFFFAQRDDLKRTQRRAEMLEKKFKRNQAG
ncbi:hypothetical protein D3C76_1208310 [compost metagenome]